MEYKEIVAVTGLPGLFQLLTTKSDGALVKSLADQSTKFISARVHNVTPLDSIEVYTTGDNVRLHDIFRKMKDSEATLPSSSVNISDNNNIKDYFNNIYPALDMGRVYVSDLKKMIKWYELLSANDLLKFEEPAEEPQTANAEGSAAEKE